MSNNIKLRPTDFLGANQTRILFTLQATGTAVFKDFCKAQNQYTGYVRSWKSLIRKLKKAGYDIEIHPGKLGGTWTEKITMN